VVSVALKKTKNEHIKQLIYCTSSITSDHDFFANASKSPSLTSGISINFFAGEGGQTVFTHIKRNMQFGTLAIKKKFYNGSFPFTSTLFHRVVFPQNSKLLISAKRQLL
jgi:hypothetical protein